MYSLILSLKLMMFKCSRVHPVNGHWRAGIFSSWWLCTKRSPVHGDQSWISIIINVKLTLYSQNPSGLWRSYPQRKSRYHVNWFFINYRQHSPLSNKLSKVFFFFIDEYLQGHQIGDKMEHLLMRTNVWRNAKCSEMGQRTKMCESSDRNIEYTDG